MATNDEHRGQRPYGVAPPGYRLPDDTRIGAVRLQVSDLQRSIEYYRTVLGLRVETQTSEIATLAPDGDGPPLLELSAPGGVTPARRGAFGLFHFAILVPDRAALGRFAGHLSRHSVPVGSADHLVSEALYLWDPDGLGIEVYADRQPDAWTHRDRELIMATDPLDLSDLVAAGGQQVWEGMPAHTTVGHVHLHVGALDVAEAFYHRALGFDKTVWHYPGALFLSAGGYHHHLGTNTWSGGPSAGSAEARLLDWELLVPSSEDADGAAESLRTAGHVVDSTASGWRTADPWGTHLRIEVAPTRT